jgi:hypothetical protein
MTPLTSKECILLISKPIEAIFVALNALSIEVKNNFEVQRQQRNDQRS